MLLNTSKVATPVSSPATQALKARWSLLLNKSAIIDQNHQWQKSPKDFLLHFESGTYTVARTVKHAILDFPIHMERLVLGIYKSEDQSLSKKFKETEEYQNVEKIISKVFINNLKIGVKAFKEQWENEEIRIYFILEKTDFGRNLDFNEITDHSWIFLQVLPRRAIDEKIFVEVRVFHRENPEVKSLDWYKKKQDIAAMLPESHEEVLLLGGPSNNLIYEGLSSNFFCVKDEKVYLAPEGTMLPGTIMHIVIDSCNELNIPLIREPPTLDDIKSWQGCFITSTSRLVLSIDRITFPEHPQFSEIQFDRCELIENLKASVQQKLISRSYDVLKQ